MKRITEIRINNVRAFYGEQPPIELPNGENLLIYGENGSGKSSLCKALETFFASLVTGGMTIEDNIFAPEPKNASIRIQFTDKLSQTSHVHEFPVQSSVLSVSESSFKQQQEILRASHKINGFLTYRSLLKTYYSEQHDGNINLFNLLVTELLANQVNPFSEKEDVNTLGEQWEHIRKLPQTRRDARRYEPAKTSLLPQFNNGLRKVLQEMEQELQILLNEYFHHSVLVQFAFPDVRYDDEQNRKTLDEPQIFLKIKYFDQDITAQPYRLFLNEARLSALAISIYLASLLRIPPGIEYKLLFLDDIFIGLDMSNRMPLLRIIHERFGQDQGYQLMLSTYDRNWYELAKNWLNRKAPKQWNAVEMYVDDYTQAFEQPKLIPAEAPLARALFHYRLPDYPASANYLRKTAEKMLTDICPPRILKQNDGITMNKLDPMIDAATLFFKKINQSTTELDNIGVYLQGLMNPLSHYDIDVSAYREEIKDVEAAANTMYAKYPERIKYAPMTLKKGSTLRLTFEVTDTIKNVYEMHLKEDLWIYQIPGESDIKLANCPCHSYKMYEIINSRKDEDIDLDKTHDSLFKFYVKMVEYEKSEGGHPSLVLVSDYVGLYEYQDNEDNWRALQKLIHFSRGNDSST